METSKQVLAKRVAQRWLLANANPEYRFRVWLDPRTKQGRQLPKFFGRFRDGVSKIAGVPCISDLGMSTQFDSVELWSKDKKSMLALSQWLESQGFETSGLW